MVVLRRNPPRTKKRFQKFFDGKLSSTTIDGGKTIHDTAHVPFREFSDEVCGFINSLDHVQYVPLTILNILTNYKVKPNVLPERSDLSFELGQSFDQIVFERSCDDSFDGILCAGVSRNESNYHYVNGKIGDEDFVVIAKFCK